MQVQEDVSNREPPQTTLSQKHFFGPPSLSLSKNKGGGGGPPGPLPWIRHWNLHVRVCLKSVSFAVSSRNQSQNLSTVEPLSSEILSVTKDTGGRYYLRSNNGKLLNIPPCKSLSTLGDRSFYMAAPKLWNDLPLFIRNISSVNAFKKALKTHLFQKAFPS